MNELTARQIEASLAPDALVVDVGGGAAAFARADWVIDALPYDAGGRLLDPQAVRVVELRYLDGLTLE